MINGNEKHKRKWNGVNKEIVASLVNGEDKETK